MVALDFILLIPLLWGAYKGYEKGFLLEVVTILAFVVALLGGFKLLYLGMDLLSNEFNIQGPMLPYIAFVIIFIGIVLLIHMLGKVLKKILDLTLLGSVDNIIGAFLGMLKWAFGFSAILWVTNAFGMTFPEAWTQGSYLYPFILYFADTVAKYAAVVLPFLQDLFNAIKELLSSSEAI